MHHLIIIPSSYQWNFTALIIESIILSLSQSYDILCKWNACICVRMNIRIWVCKIVIVLGCPCIKLKNCFESDCAYKVAMIWSFLIRFSQSQTPAPTLLQENIDETHWYLSLTIQRDRYIWYCNYYELRFFSFHFCEIWSIWIGNAFFMISFLFTIKFRSNEIQSLDFESFGFWPVWLWIFSMVQSWPKLWESETQISKLGLK